VLLLPQYFTLWAREAKSLSGFSIVYWSVFIAVGLAAARAIGLLIWKRRTLSTLPIGKPLFLLFLIPYVASHLYGFTHVDEIPVELAYATDGFSNVRIWYIVHLGMSLLTTVGMALAVAVALEDDLELDRLVLVAAIPLWPIAIHALIATLTSGLSLGDLTSEANRHFLQNETNFGMHGNAFGQYGLFAYIFLLGAISGTTAPLRRLFYLATAILVSLAIVVGFSRTAWGAWLIVTLFWNWRSAGAKKWLVPVAIVIGAAFMPAELFQRVWKGVAEGNVDEVLSGRLEHMWLPALQEVWKNPVFGQGWGAYMWLDVFQQGLVFQTATVHNAFIRLLLEAGIAGAICVCAFYRVSWAEAGRLEATEPGLLPRSMLRSTRWLIVAMLLTGITGDAVTPEVVQLYFWIGFGIFLAQRKNLRLARRPATAFRLRMPRRFAPVPAMRPLVGGHSIPGAHSPRGA
jgi:hypothetical protein